MPSPRARCLMSVLALWSALAAGAGCGWGPRRSSELPPRLTDADFWSLTTRLSEPPGVFEHSDNLVSNEIRFVHLVRMLRAGGGVYIGVGPEQNFSYIARIQPAMAFVVDIRQENRNLHLLYKALFELSQDRADFLSRLFSRARPAEAGANTSVGDLFAMYSSTVPSASLRESTQRAVRHHLVEIHGLPLSSWDLDWIDYALQAFFSSGPDIQYARLRRADAPGPSYRVLMTAVDLGGQTRSYLTSEDTFAIVKQLHERNLIVPVVGDFSGPSALRGVGAYVREHGSVVSAFYASNVEVYLNRQQTAAFCGNLASLPSDSSTWFIGSKEMQRFSEKLKSCAGRKR